MLLDGPTASPRLTRLDEHGAPTSPPEAVAPQLLAERMRAIEAEEGPRWVWDDTALRYPALLAAGVRLRRCHDLRLSRAILRRSARTADSPLAEAPLDGWDREPLPPAAPDAEEALFDLGADALGELPADALEEFARQRAALAASSAPGALGTLLALESAGALIAVELRRAGLPWDRARHEAVLEGVLGPRPAAGRRPRELERILDELRTVTGVRGLNPDSPTALVAQLRGIGIAVTSTNQWELHEIEHPAIAPLLEYKKRARLMTANGWNWLDAWVRGGRFRPDYVPGGVVTGRWATNGGGALQLPAQLRKAARADPGWRLVVADAAQLEPRILAALAGDLAMREAGRGRDLYQGMVDRGVVERREHAKLGMLGAMYGGTTGESARLLPQLARAYPRALALVEHAAREGEQGRVVSTLLGRSSPWPSPEWRALQARSAEPDAGDGERRRARTEARSWGRFTRNFVVQGTAAEWALAWMAAVRRGLEQLPPAATTGAAPDAFAQQAHLVYFLHDEVIVHAPEEQAERVTEIVREGALEAGRLLFPGDPLDVPVTAAIVEDYGQAK